MPSGGPHCLLWTSGGRGRAGTSDGVAGTLRPVGPGTPHSEHLSLGLVTSADLPLSPSTVPVSPVTVSPCSSSIDPHPASSPLHCLLTVSACRHDHLLLQRPAQLPPPAPAPAPRPAPALLHRTPQPEVRRQEQANIFFGPWITIS